MTENTQSDRLSRSSIEKESIRSETTKDGRYIPYSGGILGWFENAGVLKCERPNNYRYYEMIDADTIRMKLFERWGGGEKNVNRRAAERFSVGKSLHITLTWEGGSVTTEAKDYSSHGLRLQIVDATEFPLSKGEGLRVLIQDRPEGETLFNIFSKLMWVSNVGRTRPTINVGIAFVEMDRDIRTNLTAFLNA